MKILRFLAPRIRASGRILAAALLLGAALLAPAMAAAAITYGNDAAYNFEGNGSSYTVTPTLGQSGNNAILFVIEGVVQGSSAVPVKFNGTSMSTLGPLVSGGDGATSYYQVYYALTPTSGASLVFTNASLNAFGYMSFTYGGIGGIGNTSITGGNVINASGDSETTDSFTFSPSNAGSTILEYMAISDGEGALGTSYEITSPASSVIVENPAGNGSYHECGGAFGSDAPGSTSSMTITEGINADNDVVGGLLWAIELLPQSSGTPTKTPTSVGSPTKTLSATISPTFTRTPTYASPTITPTPSKTLTPLGSPTFTLTPTRSDTLTITQTPSNTLTYTLTPTMVGTNTYTLTYTKTPTTVPGTPTATPTTGSSSCGGPIFGGSGCFQPDYPNPAPAATTTPNLFETPGYVYFTNSLNLNYYGTGATAGGSGASASSAGSILFVFFIMEQSSNQCVNQQFIQGGTVYNMDYLAGPVPLDNVGGGGGNYYWWVYYIQNPPNSGYLNIDYFDANANGGDSPSSNATYAFWADYGNVASTGDPIGTYSLGTTPLLGGTSGSPNNTTATTMVTMQNAASTLLEIMPLEGTSWGYENNTQSPANNTVIFSPDTPYTGPYGFTNGNGNLYDPLLQDPALGLSGSGNLSMTLGEYCPGSTSPFNLTYTYNMDNNSSEALLWYIEILGNGDGNILGQQHSACGTPIAGPTLTFTLTPTITETPTVTPTQTPQVVQGLLPSMRPYGLEYVPFPTVTTSGGDAFYPLYETFTGSTEFSACGSPGSGGCWPTFGAPVNTARWHIVLQNMAAVAAANSNEVKVETRIGPDGTACTSGVYDYSTAVNNNWTSLQLPPYPQDDSNAYFWVSTTSTGSVAGGGVPYTERFDAVGDPRFVPYADVLDYNGAADDGLQGGYNWYWRNFGDATYTDESQAGFYAPFVPSATNDGYGPGGSTMGPKYDVPKLFGLIRNGIMASNGIFTSMAGAAAYVAALGGEIGGDNNSGFNNGVPCFGGPWGSTSDTYYVDEVLGNYAGNATYYPSPGTVDTNSGNINANGGVLVVTGTAGVIGWSSLPVLGELWPDKYYYSNWDGWDNAPADSTWGNLINSEEGGIAWRVPLASSQELPFGVSSTPGTYFLTSLHAAGPLGSTSFFKGGNSSGSSDYYSQDLMTAFDAAELNDATQASQDYNAAMPATYSFEAPWGLAMTTNQPPELGDTAGYGGNPWSSGWNKLGVYAAATYTAGASADGFYAANSADSSPSTDKSAAAIRVLDYDGSLTTTTGGAAGGWFLVNGLAPYGTTGNNFVAQFALAENVRTFADAGVPTNGACALATTFTNANNNGTAKGGATNTYRIPPIPLVTILSPTTSSPIQGLTTVPIQWDVRYARWDGGLYDENYPCIDANTGPCSSGDLIPNPALEWHDPQPVAFNIIYSIPSGVSPTAWYSALTGDLVPAGTGNNNTAGGAGSYMADSSDAIIPGGTLPANVTANSTYEWTYDWSGVASNSYLVRVECFRVTNDTTSGTAYPHYGYHQVTVDTEP